MPKPAKGIRFKLRRRRNRLLSLEPGQRLLIGATALCVLLSIYYGICSVLYGRHLLPGVQNPNDLPCMGFFMGAILLVGVSLVHTVDRPQGMHRLRSTKLWRRMRRRR